MLNDSLVKFKITEDIKNSLCRVVKSELLKDIKYSNRGDVCIFYNTNTEHFFISNESIEKLEYEGHIFYKHIVKYGDDKVTIKDLKREIFSK